MRYERGGGGVNLLHPSSSLWSPQSLSPSHCHWAGMHVHSPKAETAHVKWFLPQEHSALAWAPGWGRKRERERREERGEREREVSAAHRHHDEELGDWRSGKRSG